MNTNSQFYNRIKNQRIEPNPRKGDGKKRKNV